MSHLPPCLATTRLQPGELSLPEGHLAWDHRGFTLEKSLFSPTTLQMSRARGQRQRNWLLRLFGRPPRVQHRLEIELRDARQRLKLHAPVDDPAELEGLMHLEVASSHPVPLDSLRTLVSCAIELGARIAMATPRQQAETSALLLGPEGKAQGDALRDAPSREEGGGEPRDVDSLTRESSLQGLETILVQAHQALEEQGWDQAFERLQTARLWVAARKTPDATRIEVFYQLGFLFLHRNEPEQARTMFKRVLAIDPEHQASLQGLARIARDA